MDYHELQVKLANRDKRDYNDNRRLCSKPITTGSKRAKAHNQYQMKARKTYSQEEARENFTRMKARENTEPAKKRGKTYDFSCYLIISALFGVRCSTGNTNCIHPH